MARFATEDLGPLQIVLIAALLGVASRAFRLRVTI